ncbi:MAG: zf-HC2 domain-containing protein [Corynebacterium sp.]|nr:zf-HC2 domain-containing protein [Corynebacterium sp.]
MLSCEQVQAALSASLDGEDPGIPEDVLEAHLAHCPECRAFYQQAAQVNRQLNFQASTPATAPDLTAEILAGVDATWRRQLLIRNTWSWICRVGLVTMALGWLIWGVRLIADASSSEQRDYLIDAAAIRLSLAAMLLFLAIFPRFAGGIVPFLGAWWSFSFGVRIQDMIAGTFSAEIGWFLVWLALSAVVCALTWIAYLGWGVIQESLAQLRS